MSQLVLTILNSDEHRSSMSEAKEGPAKTAAMQLMERREILQAQLNTQYAILDANNATMNTPLVDPDGFPRAGT